MSPDHRFRTPVHRQGSVDGITTLQGDLILVADGDLTLGGRVTAQDTIEFTNFDHVDANAVGSAVLVRSFAVRTTDPETKILSVQMRRGHRMVDPFMSHGIHIAKGAKGAQSLNSFGAAIDKGALFS